MDVPPGGGGTDRSTDPKRTGAEDPETPGAALHSAADAVQGHRHGIGQNAVGGVSEAGELHHAGFRDPNELGETTGKIPSDALQILTQVRSPVLAVTA